MIPAKEQGGGLTGFWHGNCGALRLMIGDFGTGGQSAGTVEIARRTGGAIHLLTRFEFRRRELAGSWRTEV